MSARLAKVAVHKRPRFATTVGGAKHVIPLSLVSAIASASRFSLPKSRVVYLLSCHAQLEWIYCSRANIALTCRSSFLDLLAEIRQDAMAAEGGGLGRRRARRSLRPRRDATNASGTQKSRTERAPPTAGRGGHREGRCRWTAAVGGIPIREARRQRCGMHCSILHTLSHSPLMFVRSYTRGQGRGRGAALWGSVGIPQCRPDRKVRRELRAGCLNVVRGGLALAFWAGA